MSPLQTYWMTALLLPEEQPKVLFSIPKPGASQQDMVESVGMVVMG